MVLQGLAEGKRINNSYRIKCPCQRGAGLKRMGKEAAG